MEEETKKCPFCAETIKAQAIVCRYCGRDIPVPQEENVNMNYSETTVIKPDILPPKLTDEFTDSLPQMGEILNDLAKKYIKDVNYFNSSTKWGGSKIQQYRTAIKDMMSLNFSSISFFLESKLNRKGKKELETNIATYATLATMGSWVVGIDYFINHRDNAISIINNKNFNLRNLPPKTYNYLLNAANIPYWYFGMHFSAYYDSDYGNNMKFQKESHFIDTYQSILVAVKECFLEGIRYKNSK